MALPKIVCQHVKQQNGHENIYVLDRGMQSDRSLQTFDQQKVGFVCRAKENRKYEPQANLMKEGQ